MRVFLCQLILTLLIGSNALSGQTLDSGDLEGGLQDLSTPPVDRVVDFGEVFSANSVFRNKLSRRLKELKERYQFSVYFIAYSGIIGSDVSEKAAEFRDLWLGAEEEGLVFVCDTDMKKVTYALTKVDSFPLDGSNPTWKLADYEVAQAMFGISQIDSSEMDEEKYLSTMGLILVDGLESRLKSQPETKKKGPGGILGAVVAAAGLIGMVVWWLRRKAGAVAAAVEKTLFPTIEIPNRFGAHYGGGSVSEISYQSPPAHPDS